jgi:hypothetical protein
MIIFNPDYPDYPFYPFYPDNPDYSNFFTILNFLILLVLSSIVSFLKFINLILYTLLNSKSDFSHWYDQFIVFGQQFVYFSLVYEFDNNFSLIIFYDLTIALQLSDLINFQEFLMHFRVFGNIWVAYCRNFSWIFY